VYYIYVHVATTILLIECVLFRVSTDNFPPVITLMSADEFITIGEQNQLVFAIIDPDGDSFTVTNADGFGDINCDLIDGTRYECTIFFNTLQELDNLIPFEITATDARGAVSSLVQPLDICACVNQQTCTLDGVLGSDVNTIANCECSRGNYFISLIY